MLDEFKSFILRGNVIDLAVAVVIGAAFTAIITAIVDGLINPLIALLIGSPTIAQAAFVIGGSGTEADPGTTFSYGLVIGAIINFVAVAAVLFLIVKGANKLMDARRDETTDEVTVEETPEDIVLLREIRDALSTGSVPPPPPM